MEQRGFSLEPTDAETTKDAFAGLPASRLQAWARLAPRGGMTGIPTQREIAAA